MKNLLFIICLLASIHAFAQTENFTGIGIFKIGSDTSVVYKYASENKLKVEIISSSDQLRSYKLATNPYANKYMKKTKDWGKDIIGKVDKNTSDYSLNVNFCPEVTQYVLTSYEVSGVKTTEIKLLFYKNRLNKFECKYDQNVLDALDQKYGKAELVVTKDTIKCLYNITGITRNLISTTYSKNRQMGDIKVVALMWTAYDDNCKEMYLSSFYYEQVNRELAQCSLEARKNKLTPKSTKKDLKDF